MRLSYLLLLGPHRKGYRFVRPYFSNWIVSTTYTYTYKPYSLHYAVLKVKNHREFLYDTINLEEENWVCLIGFIKNIFQNYYKTLRLTNDSAKCSKIIKFTKICPTFDLAFISFETILPVIRNTLLNLILIHIHILIHM